MHDYYRESYTGRLASEQSDGHQYKIPTENGARGDVIELFEVPRIGVR